MAPASSLPPVLALLLLRAGVSTVPAPGPHCAVKDEHQFTASSWGKACACDTGKSVCTPSPGIEPMVLLGAMDEGWSAECLLHGPGRNMGRNSACSGWGIPSGASINDGSSATEGTASQNFFAAEGTASQPAGRHVVRIYGLDQLRGRKLYAKTDLPPLWIDGAVATLRAQSVAFFAKYHAKGGTLDELVQDTELFSYGGFFLHPYTEPAPSALSPEYGNASTIRKALRAQWLVFQRDARFPALLKDLEARGFRVNRTDPELLASALFPFEDDWALIRPQPPVAAGGNPNRGIWNQYLMERRSQCWRSAFVEPAQKYWPSVVGSNYQYHRSSSGSYCAPDTVGLLGCLGGPGAVGYDIQAPSEYESPNMNQTSWTEEVALLKRALNISEAAEVQGLGPGDHVSGFNRMRLAAYSVRGMVLANASARVKPWLGLRGYFQKNKVVLDPAVELDYYQEMVFHMALSGCGDFYFFNPYQCESQDPPLGVAPVAADNAALSSALSELTLLFGCGTRRWVEDATPPRLLDDVMLTGVARAPSPADGSRIGGGAPLCTVCPMCCGVVWRLTFPFAAGVGGAASGLLASRSLPGALNFSKLALRGPGGVQKAHGCFLLFPRAKLIEAGAWGGNTSTKVGVWMWQEPGAAPPYTECGAWREPWAGAAHPSKTDDGGADPLAERPEVYRVVVPQHAAGEGRRTVELTFHPPAIITGALNTSLYHDSGTVHMLNSTAAFVQNFFAIDELHVFGQLLWYGGDFIAANDTAERKYSMYMWSSDSGSTWGRPPQTVSSPGGTVPPGWFPTIDTTAGGRAFRPGGEKRIVAPASRNNICACSGAQCDSMPSNFTAGCGNCSLSGGCAIMQRNHSAGFLPGSLPAPPWYNFSSAWALDFTADSSGALISSLAERTTLFTGIPRDRGVLAQCGSQFGKTFMVEDWGVGMQNTATLADGTLVTVLCLCQGDRYQNWIYPPLNFSMYSLNSFASTDAGATWLWRGTVANAKDFPESATGPQSETDVVALADGKTLLSVTRMDGDGPCHPPEAPGQFSEGGSYRYYYESYSSDGGVSWSKARPMTRDRAGSVWPRLAVLGSTGHPGGAAALMSGGRICNENITGLFLWANDGMARAPGSPNADVAHAVWDRISVSHVHNTLWRGDSAYLFDEGINASDLFESMTYTSLTPLSNTSVLLTYNRFYHPGNGVDGCWPNYPKLPRPAEYPCGTGFSMRIDLSTSDVPLKVDDEKLGEGGSLQAQHSTTPKQQRGLRWAVAAFNPLIHDFLLHVSVVSAAVQHCTGCSAASSLSPPPARGGAPAPRLCLI